MSEERVARIIGRLSSAFTREPGSNIEQLVRTVETELQAVENALGDIQAAHQYESATGAALDEWAAIYGVTRAAGETDASVRARIKVAAQVRTACGTLADIRSLVARITGYDDADIQVIEFESMSPTGGWGKQPWGTSPWGGSNRSAASFRLVLNGFGGSSGFRLLDLVDGIDRVRAAGVLFNRDSTVFLTDPGSSAIMTGGQTSVLIDAPYPGIGWGTMPWGSGPWGGFGERMTGGPVNATMIP